VDGGEGKTPFIYFNPARQAEKEPKRGSSKPNKGGARITILMLRLEGVKKGGKRGKGKKKPFPHTLTS